jgi:histidyl-tRNA synthetase
VTENVTPPSSNVDKLVHRERIQSVKGMQDLFEESLRTWRHVERTAADVFAAFGYGEIRTPIVEEVQLFVRSVGEATDIVEKEMYAFVDRDREATHLALRPENTAGVVRALVQHGLLPADADARVFYIGAMFRRERPQKGRYRQFHQLGAEAFGFAQPAADVEMMAMLHVFAERLGLSGVSLIVNTLGDKADRPRYAAALQAYLSSHEGALSEDSRRRLHTNPLRILDSKDAGDQEIVRDAPKPRSFLSDDARAHFEAVMDGLTRLSVPFVVDDRLVRGLDYYTRTVFELLATTGLGAQNAVAAGGRYDNLVHELGGRETPALGFAAGIERIVLLLEDAGKTVGPRGADIMLIGADESGRRLAQVLAHGLRQRGLFVDVDVRDRGVKALMKRADKSGARKVVVIGDREQNEGRAQVKTMATGVVQDAALTVDSLVLALQS